MTTRPYIPVEAAAEMADAYASQDRLPGHILATARGWTVAITGLSFSQIISHTRNPAAVNARQLVAEIMIAAGMSYPATGKAINRDHTSIWHLVNNRTAPEWLLPYREIAVRLGTQIGKAEGLSSDPIREEELQRRVDAIRARHDAVNARRAEHFARVKKAKEEAAKWAADWHGQQAILRGVTRAKLLPREYRPTVGEMIEDRMLLALPPTAEVMADLRRAMIREVALARETA